MNHKMLKIGIPGGSTGNFFFPFYFSCLDSVIRLLLGNMKETEGKKKERNACYLPNQGTVCAWSNGSEEKLF